MSESVAVILDAIRREGRRITTARRVIVELLAGTREHFSAEDIVTQVHDAHPEIHLSTVYRTLECLCAWGFVVHVHQIRGPSFFQVVSAHHHVVCEECGRVLDVPATEFDDLIARLRDAYGFELQVGRVALAGRCSGHSSVT